MTFADLMETVVEMKDCFDINMVAVILWMIWECRNSDCVGGCSTDLRTIRVKASTFLHDFSSVQIPRQVQLSVSGNNSRWIPPNPLTYKVNFDWAIFKELGAAGLGMVIRDSEDSVIGALAERISLPCSVAKVEALACRRAILIIREGDDDFLKPLSRGMLRLSSRLLKMVGLATLNLAILSRIPLC
ncbi:uncharacterized protein LOC126704654 [Quercus robur]|uniref:uncharacterized protein LOC126704654 n=1 Tax=Quercus robur TaxID=38942 RepID=UPI0021630398|nr:uncharacterized protein LOC126704654 [Quercus robur]